MKILMVADPHGSHGLRVAGRVATDERVDAIICVGDIWDPHTDMPVPTHHIRGNHEREHIWLDYHDPERSYGASGWSFKNVTCHEDWTKFEVGGITFGVIGRMDEDSNRHLLGTYQLGDEWNRSFKKDAEGWHTLVGSDVLLFHDAPYPFIINGEIRGSKFLTDVVATVQPRMVFHGHMHTLQQRTLDSGVVAYGLPAIDPNLRVGSGYGVLHVTPRNDGLSPDLTVETHTFIQGLH